MPIVPTGFILIYIYIHTYIYPPPTAKVARQGVAGAGQGQRP
jgi:hypothetical protein